MRGFVGDIKQVTKENANFRRVLYTGKQLQLVVMTLAPGEDIGEETHMDCDQFFRFEKGKGEVWIDGRKSEVEDDFAIVVPAGAKHNVRNTGVRPLKLYTLYGPPQHEDGLLQVTKADAVVSMEHFAGRTTE
jgi:mannose-6-phosphate isomerase-like protein (cupin superfamily)